MSDDFDSARSRVRTASSVMHSPAFRSLALVPRRLHPPRRLRKDPPAASRPSPSSRGYGRCLRDRSAGACPAPPRTNRPTRPSANSADEGSTPRPASSPLSHPAKLASLPVTLGIEMAFWSRPRAWPASKASLSLAMMVDESNMSWPSVERVRPRRSVERYGFSYRVPASTRCSRA
jgi:hypothetical protein